MSRARAATSLAASARSSTPAAWAAEISPIECPARKSGRTPRCARSRKRAVWKAKSAVCVYRVRLRSSASSPNITSLSGSSSCGSSSAQTSSSASAKTGYVSYNSRPIPGRCDPWPEKRKAVFPVPLGAALPVTTRAVSSPSASSRSAVRKVSRVSARTTARCSKVARAVARVWATSPMRSSGWASRCSPSSAACARRADSLRPDSSHGTSPVSGVPVVGSGWGIGWGAAAVGACSRMTWALVPLMPKEEMAARRGRSTVGQGVCWVRRVRLPACQSTSSLGRSMCRDWGSSPCCMAWIILMMPAAPAAAWVWPMLDLIEPR